MPLVSINCCEDGIEIRKFFCFCRGSSSKRKDEVVYTDASEQLVIISTPQIEVEELVVFDDISETETAVFCMGDDGHIRYLMVHGLSMFYDPQDPERKMQPEFVMGKNMEDVLPNHFYRFLKPIYTQTLQGRYLQLTTMSRRGTHLIRTFPISDHKKQILAGMMVMSPFKPELVGDINRFALNQGVSSLKPPKKKGAPPSEEKGPGAQEMK